MKSARTTGLGATCLALFLVLAGAAFAQSGRGAVHGYVAFDGISYNDLIKQNVRAKIELRGNTEYNQSVYATETNERGSYDFKSVPAGEYLLRISSPGFKVYEVEIYIPSDFISSLATMLKSTKNSYMLRDVRELLKRRSAGWAIGVVVPLLLVAVDPGVFRADAFGVGSPILAGFKPFGYAGIALGIAAMVMSLLFAHGSPAIAGVLAAGSVFAAAD